MDLQTTIPMLNQRKIKILHVEPTDVCQAACPLCARETDPDFDPKLTHHLSINQILSVFDQEKIANLDKMFMCGTYGDPAAGKYTLEIFREFRKINPNIVLGMNSNGALQNTMWWQELAHILNQPRDYVVFSIDGLEDTNHIYRKHVSWNKLIDNVKAFVAAGGSAHWDMLVYQHNEHQVKNAIDLATELGFTWFRSKVSKRPLASGLSYPVSWAIQKIPQGNISCIAINEQSIYLDCHGVLHPCCWQPKVSSDDITALETSWLSDRPNSTCAATCTTGPQGNSFSNQWRLELALK